MTRLSPRPRRSIKVNGRFLAQPLRGVQRVATELVKALDAADAEGGGEAFTLLTPHNAGPAPKLETARTQVVGRRTGNAWEQLDLPGFVGRDLLLNLCNMAPLSRSGDVIFIHDAQFLISPQSYSWAFRSWYGAALPRLASRSSRVVTVSDYAKAMLVEHRIASAEKISVVHNGVDHILQTPTDDSGAAALGLGALPFLMALSNTQSHKNIPLLFEAFRDPRLQGLRLVLVGSASRDDFIRTGNTPPDTAVFAGPVSDGVMRALLERAVAFAFPSTTEGFGLPPLEAMLLGVPAIIAPCGALPEVCADAAIYAAAAAPEAWADAIHKLAEDERMRAHWATKGRAHAQTFRWSQSAGKLRALVEEVL